MTQKTKVRILIPTLAAYLPLTAVLSALLLSGCFWEKDAPAQEVQPTAAAVLPSSLTTAAPPTSRSACPNAIDWAQAAYNIGKQTTVRGPVVRATYASTSNGKPTFIDLGKPYPDPDRFNVVIWGTDRGKLPGLPEDAYLGKTICVTGIIGTYRGVPQIIVNSPAAIVVD